MPENASKNLERISLESLDIPGNFLSRLVIKSKLANSQTQSAILGAVVFVCIAFVPLLLLSMVYGLEWSQDVKVPLHKDFITLSRYLIAAPLLIFSDRLTRPWLARAALRFSELVSNDDREYYNKLFNRVFYIRSSFFIDIILLGLALVTSLFGTSIVLAMDHTSWQAGLHEGAHALTSPGYWNAFVSAPLFRFVVFSWTVDYLLWVYFLFRVSRFKLNVVPTHPDRAGGLSFVSAAHLQYCIASFALSCTICSFVAQAVEHTHMPLHSFTNLGIAFLLGILLVFVAPLLVFTPSLLYLRLRGIFSQGALCHELSEMFAAKWITARKKDEQPILSSADPSALADLNSSYETVASMTPVVFDKQFVIAFLLSVCLPALPLVATVIPLQDLFMQIMKALT